MRVQGERLLDFSAGYGYVKIYKSILLYTVEERSTHGGKGLSSCGVAASGAKNSPNNDTYNKGE